MKRWLIPLVATCAFHALLAVALAFVLGRDESASTLPNLDVTHVELSFAEEETPSAPVRVSEDSPSAQRVGTAFNRRPPKADGDGMPSLPSLPPVPDVAPPLSLPSLPMSAPQQARVDAPPNPREAIRPLYPKGARRRGEEGRVVLELVVLASGRVGEARVASSSGFAELDAAALRAARSATFSPAREEGRAVEATVHLPLDFKLK